MIPTMALGYAIGRIGCFVSGDGDYGFATDVKIPLLVFHIWRSFSSVIPVWNTPVMETLISFSFFIYFQYYAKFQNFKKLSLVAQYLILSSLARLSIEFLRLNKAVIPFFEPPVMADFPILEQRAEFLKNYFWHGFSQSQYVAIITLMIGLFLMTKNKLWQKELS